MLNIRCQIENAPEIFICAFWVKMVFCCWIMLFHAHIMNPQTTHFGRYNHLEKMKYTWENWNYIKLSPLAWKIRKIDVILVFPSIFNFFQMNISAKVCCSGIHYMRMKELGSATQKHFYSKCTDKNLMRMFYLTSNI